MDPLSLTASIVAVLELTGKLLEYLRDVRHKSDDQAQLAVEASNIYSLLASLGSNDPTLMTHGLRLFAILE